MDLIPPSSLLSSDHFAKFIADETEKWAKVVLRVIRGGRQLGSLHSNRDIVAGQLWIVVEQGIRQHTRVFLIEGVRGERGDDFIVL